MASRPNNEGGQRPGAPNVLGALPPRAFLFFFDTSTAWALRSKLFQGPRLVCDTTASDTDAQNLQNAHNLQAVRRALYMKYHGN
jgi:hypothetical protein